MKKFIIFGLLATSLAFADASPVIEATTSESLLVTKIEDVKNDQLYISLGLGPFPIPMPLFGFGRRFQNNHHGADISVQAISFGRGFSVLKENVDYLYYFKPKLSSQFYMGLGGSATEFVSKGRWQFYLSPQILIGKQYINSDGDTRFFQAQIEPCFVDLNKIHKHKKYTWGTFPAVVLSYGICF